MHWIQGALILGLLVGSWAVFDELPDRIPVHFGLDGVPDAWADRTPARWLTLPFVAMGTSLLLYGSAWMVGRFPSAMNVPEAARYRALSAGSKTIVVAQVQDILLWIGLLVNAVFLVLQAGSYQVAVGSTDRLPWWSGGWAILVVVLVGSTAAVVVLVTRLSSTIRRLSDFEQESPSRPSTRSASP